MEARDTGHKLDYGFRLTQNDTFNLIINCELFIFQSNNIELAFSSFDS